MGATRGAELTAGSGRDSKRFSFETYVLCGAATLGLLAVVDLGVGGRSLTFAGLVITFGLGLAAGAFVGGAAGLMFRGLSRWPAWIRGAVWGLLGAFVASHLVFHLGVLLNLSGRNAHFGWLALFFSLCFGSGVFVLGMAMQPSSRYAGGWLIELPKRRRMGAVVLLTLVFALLCWVDRYWFEGLYLAAHQALRWCSWAVLWCLVLIASAAWSVFRHRTRVVLVFLVVAWSIVSIASVGAEDEALLHRLMQRPYAGSAVVLLRELADPDRDGYSAILGGGDCDSFRASVHPGAEEIPGNGVDDNCVGGDATPVVRADTSAVPIPNAPSPLSIVLITVDTLRADRLGVHGSERPTSPRIDEWSQGALRFSHAYTTGAWTSLALSSLFRGVYPRRLDWTWVHETDRYRLLRAPVNEQLQSGEEVRKVFGVPLEEQRQPLNWWLRRRGMYTAAVVDDGHSRFLEPAAGVVGGFERYLLVDDFPEQQRNDEGITDRAIELLMEMPPSQEFFLWVHYFGPHEPSTIHPGTPIFGTDELAKYDHEVRATDTQVGRLLEHLHHLAMERPLGVVLSSDHGETMRPHSRDHGSDLNQENMHIPLMMRGPGVQPGVRGDVVSLVDLMPTMLAWTETPAPAGLDGVDLRRPPVEDNRVILFDTWRFGRNRRVELDFTGATDGRVWRVWDLVRHTRAVELVSASALARDKSASLPWDSNAVAHFDSVLTQYLEQNRSARIAH